MRVLPRALGQPEIEVVTLDQLRAHLNIEAGDDGDDALLRGFLIAARNWMEEWLGRVLGRQTVRATFESWPDWLSGTSIDLLMPVESVDSVRFTAPGGVITNWADFVARQSQGGVMLVRPKAGTSWPTLGDDPVITLEATAGWDTVPEPVVTGVMMLAAFLYANRDGIGDGRTVLGKLPPEIAEMVRPWRWRLIG
jgi:uncharacterized phiE125 gp8 family phage protein